MNFQQLRIVREAVRRNYNLTAAASALFTSQSGVSKHIKDPDEELGIAHMRKPSIGRRNLAPVWVPQLLAADARQVIGFERRQTAHSSPD